MTTWYDKFFWKKKQLTHPNISLGKDCIANAHRSLVKASASHTGTIYLIAKCRNGNVLFGCETVVSVSPLPLPADLSGSLDLCVMGMHEPNPPQCSALAVSLRDLPRSLQRHPPHHPRLCDCLDFGTSSSTLWYSSTEQIKWNFAVFLHPPWEDYEQMTEQWGWKVLVSSPCYLIHFVPFQLCKKIVWIGHGLGSPTKTDRTKKLENKPAHRYAGCMEQS